MPMPLHAMYECYLTFFLKKDKYVVVNDTSTGLQYQMSSALCSLFTSSRGCAYYKGEFVLLSVQFISNGFFAIFRIPQKILLNSILPLDDILGNDAASLTEQLENCDDVKEMGALLDSFFIKKFFSQKPKHYTPVIAGISNTIFKHKAIVSVDQLSTDANMSMRNFERKFTDEVGMSPKLYMRIVRFFQAVELKMMCPQQTWTSIAHVSGYFDQAHFIRECKEFSSKTPEELFSLTPPPSEKFIKKVEL